MSTPANDYTALALLAQENHSGNNGYFEPLSPQDILSHLQSSEDMRLADYVRQAGLNETEASLLAFLRSSVHIKQDQDGALRRVYTGTLQKYAQILCRFFNHARLHVRGVQGYHLADYINTRLDSKRSANTVNLEIRALRSFFKFMHQAGFLPANPAGTVKEIKGSNKHHFSHVLTFEEARDILYYAREKLPFRDFLILAVLRFAGLRAEEVTELKFSDLVQGVSAGWFLEVRGKGNKTRQVPIPAPLAMDILELRYRSFGVPKEILNAPGLKDVPIFAKKFNLFAPLSYNSVYHLVTKISKKALGRKVTPHWFRHTFATHASMKDLDIKTISSFLGHSSINTTMMYEQSFELQKGNFGKILADEYIST